MGIDAFSLKQADGSTAFVSILAAAISSVLFDVASVRQSSRRVRSYSGMGYNLGSCAIYLLPVHLLWMCGIHGNNVLDSVSNCLNLGVPVFRDISTARRCLGRSLRIGSGEERNVPSLLLAK